MINGPRFCNNDLSFLKRSIKHIINFVKYSFGSVLLSLVLLLGELSTLFVSPFWEESFCVLFVFSLFREFSEEFTVFNETSLTGELVFEDMLFIAL